MSIADWFKAREEARYTAMTPTGRGDLPDGVWSKCDGCKRIVYAGELEESLFVCPHCGQHSAVPAPHRVTQLADEGTFEETDAGVASVDPLKFNAAKSYKDVLAKAKDTTGLEEAVVTGLCVVGGVPVILCVMDFRFVGGSMGSAVGEKVARAFETAQRDGLPVVTVVASGGARMQEGMLSLMQMAKTAAGARSHGEAGLPHVAILTNPTSGGVTASFAVIADVILAEPGAFIGFTGPRVIEQTIGQKVPKGFQSAEFQVEHGMVDLVVARPDLKDTLVTVLRYLTAGRAS